MIKKIFLPVIFFTFISSSLFAQRSNSSRDHSKFKFFDNPTIEISYGLTNIKLNGYSSKISDAGLLELKLGFTNQRDSYFGKKILRYDNRFLFLSNSSNDLTSKSKSSGVNSSMWRFGFGNKEGYGLKLGSVSLMPYTSNSFAWTNFEYDKNSFQSEADKLMLDNFNGTFRFGSTTEGGINLQLFPGFSIHPKYEISDIYPRHLFGKQFMSLMIEVGGLILIDSFTKNVLRNAPVAGTFVNFILKNAYEYGFYQLRKDKMNWPFTSSAPLRYNTFKLGMTFTF
jgi:hypothetical protein